MITVVTASLPERSSWLAEACSSVAAQTYRPDIHLIGVDHARSGTATIRNGLIGTAQTPWVAILDDDDLIEPNHLERLAEFADEGVSVVYSYCGGHVPPGCNRPFDPTELRKRNFIPATILLNKEAWETVGGYPDVYAEDWALLLRILERYGPSAFRCCPEVTWTYRRGSPGSKSAHRPPNARREALLAGTTI